MTIPDADKLAVRRLAMQHADSGNGQWTFKEDELYAFVEALLLRPTPPATDGRLRAALEGAAGWLHWGGSASPGILNEGGKALMLQAENDARQTLSDTAPGAGALDEIDATSLVSFLEDKITGWGPEVDPWEVGLEIIRVFNRAAPSPSVEAVWRPIESAPRDGTIFLGRNADHPSFGCRPMHRQVRHELNEHGEMVTVDLGGWVIISDVEPDYHEGHTTGPGPAYSIAPDNLNSSVRYSWLPLPASPVQP